MKHLPNIEVNIIPHKSQIYETAGNYGIFLNNWWIDISKMSKWEYESIVLIHELVEMVLTKKRKISWDKITKFDTDHPELNDPGNDKMACYHKEHIFATRIEKLLAKELGIDWEVYDKSFEKLKY